MKSFIVVFRSFQPWCQPYHAISRSTGPQSIMPVGIGGSCFWILWKPAKKLFQLAKGGFQVRWQGGCFGMSWCLEKIGISLCWPDGIKKRHIGRDIFALEVKVNTNTIPHIRKHIITTAIYPLLTWTLVHLGAPNCDVFFHPNLPLCQETVCIPIKMEFVKMTPAQMPCFEYQDSVSGNDERTTMRVMTRCCENEKEDCNDGMIETWQHSWLP